MGGPSHGEAKQDTRGARGEWHSVNSNGHIYRFLLKQESGKIITHKFVFFYFFFKVIWVK